MSERSEDRGFVSLSQRVGRSADRWPEAAALRCGDVEWSYAELCSRAGRIAASLLRGRSWAEPGVVVILGQRTAETYAALLGISTAGLAYLPLNPEAPASRNARIARLARADCFVVCAGAEAAFEQLAAEIDTPVHALSLDGDAASRSNKVVELPLLQEQIAAGEGFSAEPDSLAYLLFTSGSTGVPKGVPIRQRNAAAFLDYMASRYELAPGDRCSQAFELTFDPSVFDMFATWQSGACLCVPRRSELLNPAGWIRRQELTLWYSVPSIALFMKKFGALKPGSLPSLRYSLFAGEALPVAVAQTWKAAAPNSTIENLYGPTEATVTCLHYRWTGEEPEEWTRNGTVPVGDPNPGLQARLVDSAGEEVAPGEAGELLISGAQVSGRYWDDPERSAAAFFASEGSGAGYRTGDLMQRVEGGTGPLLYLGRIDNQVQVLGHRVELGEVEGALRRASGVASVVAVGWPELGPNVAGGIEGFVESDNVDMDAVRDAIATDLPEYMVPRRVHALAAFPLTAHGKIDRAALITLLRESEG